MESALERLERLWLSMAARYINLLDAISPDADLEATCEDEGAQCDDEGVSGINDPDREPSLGAIERGPGGSGGWNMPYHLIVDAELNGDEEDDCLGQEDNMLPAENGRPARQYAHYVSNVGLSA